VVLALLRDIPPYIKVNNFIWCRHDRYQSPPFKLVDIPVAGASNTGFVSGNKLYFDKEEQVYYFVEDSGESGQSGTLMFALTFPHPTLLGVYKGISTQQHMKPRGIIVPLYLTDLTYIYLDKIYPSEKIDIGVYEKGYIIPKEVTINTVKDYGYYEEDNKRHYGMKMNANPVKLCGAVYSRRGLSTARLPN